MKLSRSTSISISSFSFLFILLLSGPALSQKAAEDEPSYRRRVIDQVVLVGAKSFDESDIKRVLYTKPNRWFNIFKKRYLSRSNVNVDTTAINRFYARRGHLFSSVKSDVDNLSDNKARVTFFIYEGRRTFLSGVSVEGGLEPISQKFNRYLEDFDIGEPVDAEEALSGGFRLRDVYANNGYPYAVISRRYDFNYDSTQANVVYAVSESVFTVNGFTQIISDVTTRPNVVLREIVSKPGKMYRQQDVIDSEQRLYSTGLFKFVNMSRDDSTAAIDGDTCRVGFKLGLDERKLYFANLGIGLGSEEENELVLRNYGQLGVRNIGGTGRKLIFSVRPYFRITDNTGNLSGLRLGDLARDLNFTIIRSSFELDYVTPWFFQFRIPVTARLVYEPYTLYQVQDFSYRYDRVGLGAVFSREVDRFTISRLTANTEYINIRNVPPEQEEIYRDLGHNQIRRSLLLYTERDTRDNIFVPQKGSYTFTGIDYVGGLLGGDFNFHKMQLSWSRYRILTGQNVLATRIWVGWLNDKFRNGLSAPSDRFLIGGSTTVRGYTNRDLGPKFDVGPLGQADSVAGGNYMLLSNVEVRRPLFWRIGGSLFADAGNAYARFSEITPLSIRFSSGLGLQFFTPIGPIRLDYAVRLKKQFDLGAGLWHLSILYAF